MQVRCKIGLGQLLPDLTSFTAVAKAFECLVQDAVGWFQGMVRAGSPPCGCCMLLASKARTLLMRPWLLGLRLDHVALNARKSSSWQRQLLLEEGRAQEFPRPASCETLLAGQARRGSRQHPDAQLWGGQSARMTSSPPRSQAKLWSLASLNLSLMTQKLLQPSLVSRSSLATAVPWARGLQLGCESAVATAVGPRLPWSRALALAEMVQVDPRMASMLLSQSTHAGGGLKGVGPRGGVAGVAHTLALLRRFGLSAPVMPAALSALARQEAKEQALEILEAAHKQGVRQGRDGGQDCEM